MQKYAMIDWYRTEQVYGFSESDRISKYQKVIIICDICGNEKHATKHYHYRALRRNGFYRCKKCADYLRSETSSKAIKKKWQDKEYRAKQESRTHNSSTKELARQRALELWQDPEYKRKFFANFNREKACSNLDVNRGLATSAISVILKDKWANDAEYRIMMSEQSRSLWDRGDYRERITAKLVSIYSNPELRAMMSERAFDYWSIRGNRDKLSETITEKWQDEDYRRKCALARSNRCMISQWERLVGYVLDAYDIKYVSQAVVGPWVFDYLLQDSNTLIEVNGLYWHDRRKSLDKAKRTYVHRHTDYKLLVIEESDLLAEFKLRSLFEKSAPLERISFDDLQFEQCVRDCVIGLFSAFHYLGKPNRGGRYFAVRHDNEVIAAAILSPVHRLEVATSIGYNPPDVIEISRFIIHPRYQIKNLASWTISRLCRWAKNNNRLAVIAFSDTSTHIGTIYVASGFRCLGSTRSSDYEYRDLDGFRIHKKTVWDAAKRNSMSEFDYALRFGLVKIKVKPRHKFVRHLK